MRGGGSINFHEMAGITVVLVFGWVVRESACGDCDAG